MRWSQGCRLAATLIAAVALVVSIAEAGDEVYLRAGIDVDRPADTRFTDGDCASTVPAALYGCGRGPDGAPHGSVGAFGTVPTVEVGLGYAATAAVRLEAVLEYRPRFDFAGQTNFLEPGLQQSAAADLSSLAGLVATYLDLPGLGLSSVGPFDPFIGAGVGAVRNRIGETHMTFPRTTTIVPGASHVDVVWMVTAGVATDPWASTSRLMWLGVTRMPVPCTPAGAKARWCGGTGAGRHGYLIWRQHGRHSRVTASGFPCATHSNVGARNAYRQARAAAAPRRSWTRSSTGPNGPWLDQ